MASRSSIVVTLALLITGAGLREAAAKGSKQTPAKKPATAVADAGVEPTSAPEAAPAAADVWDFDKVDAPMSAHGEFKDQLQKQLLEQMGAKLDGSARLQASAHPNGAGGVTLTLTRGTAGSCELYATRVGEWLKFDDCRCSFPLFEGEMRTTATCRRITGRAHRVKDAVLVEAMSPDCTAIMSGFTVEATAKVEPVVEKR
jgi:hypothetical protein